MEKPVIVGLEVGMKLGFGRIETVLREIHRIDPGKEAPFRARLRYLQQRVDLGIPRAGGGRRANFTIGHALLFELGIQFEQFGLSPEQIAEIFRYSGRKLLQAISEVASHKGDASQTVLVHFVPQALSALQERSDEHSLFPFLRVTASSDNADISCPFSDAQGLVSLAIVNVSAVVCRLVEGLADEDGAAPLYEELARWAVDEWEQERGDQEMERLMRQRQRLAQQGKGG